MVAVAEEGSIAAAARRVHLSQPALTRSIQTLEAEAAIPLFDRGARGMTLTSTGRMVVERARRILFETRCLIRDLTLISEHVIGNVNLGLGPFPAAALLPDILQTLHRDWPKLQVAAQVNGAPTLFGALHTEVLDFIVVERRTVPQAAELEVRRLRPEQAGFFVRPSHPLCVNRYVTPIQLREATLVSAPFPARGHAAFRRLLGCRSDERLPLQLESNDFHALRLLACRSDAVLLGPMRAVTAEVKAGALVQLEVEDTASLAMEFAVVHLAQRTLSPAALRVLAVVEALG